MSESVVASSPYHGVVLGDVWAGSWVREVGLLVAAVVLQVASARLAIRLEFTPIPLTFQTFAVLLIAAGFGPVRAVASLAVYLALGWAGLAVFSPDPITGQARTGPQMVPGPSAGFLVGVVVATLVVGYLSRYSWDRQFHSAWVQMATGNLIIYSFGVPWLAHYAHLSLEAALLKGLLPFLVGDALKIALASALLPVTWRVVRRA